MTEDFDDRKARASAWFRTLRDRIVAGFEALEDAQTTGPFAGRPAGRQHKGIAGRRVALGAFRVILDLAACRATEA